MPALPARAALRDGRLFVEQREIAPDQLLDPFLQQTVQRLPSPASLLEVPAAELGQMSPDAAPRGIVFHVGRCGSTLVSQLLKQHEQLVVYSEPLAINEVLVPPHGGDRALRVAALRSLGACFARHASRPYVLKLSSWNTLYCALVAEAFPGTPWAFVVRDPLEVCVSLLAQRPGWLRDAGDPAQLFADVVDPHRACDSSEAFVANLVAAYCHAIAALDPRHGCIVRYADLPRAVWTTLVPHFGLAIDEALVLRMAAVGRLHAKAPVGAETPFAADAARKRAAASPALRRAVGAVALPGWASASG